MTPLSENISIDDDHDCIVAYGNKISGEVLRILSCETPEGIWFRIKQSRDGIATVEKSYIEKPRLKSDIH